MKRKVINFHSHPDYIKDRWIRRIISNKTKTLWGKFMRWWKWQWINKDYCPQCDKETYWMAEGDYDPYYGYSEDDMIMNSHYRIDYYYCGTCGLSTMSPGRIDSITKNKAA